MKYIFLTLFGGWKRKKPEFDSEFLLLTAEEDVRTGVWIYSVWQIVKVEDGLDGPYYGLCKGDGEEWGDRDDLTADLYKKIPLL